MNPLLPDRFDELWEDVGGLLDFRVGRLLGVNPATLPDYVPVLQHEGSRSRPPEVAVVSIPLFQVLRNRRDGSYGPRFVDGAALRQRFNLGRNTQIVLRGVDDDRKLERFWQYHRVHNVGAALAKLDLAGVTVPNFSFFTDATRFQILRNRKRIVLTCERLSEAGVKVIPHLNALTRTDWKFWAEFLNEHPEITVICKEFQTGLKEAANGLKAYRELVDLQDAVGRPLHPILVAGGRYYQEALRDFSAGFTVLDSTAFMGALARQVLVDAGARQKWMKRPTPCGVPIDDHFDANVRGRRLFFEFGQASERSAPAYADAAGQMTWDEMMEYPHLTAQPVAAGISERHSHAKSLHSDFSSH